MSTFDQPQAQDLVCHTWFERDRQNVRLETPSGRVIFDLWDDDVTQAIEDGFLKRPRHPRPSDSDWLPSAIDYAKDMGFLQPDGALITNKSRIGSRIARP